MLIAFVWNAQVIVRLFVEYWLLLNYRFTICIYLRLFPFRSSLWLLLSLAFSLALTFTSNHSFINFSIQSKSLSAPLKVKSSP